MEAFVCDLDHTLIGDDGRFGERTLGALGHATAAGLHVIVATGRMFRSVRPYLDQAGLTDPVICYQGAAVVEPATGTFLLHEPIPLALAREAIAALQEVGYFPNCYVDDELVVAHHTPYSQAYAQYQDIPVSEVGDLLAWLDRPPTKLVAVREPEDLQALRERLAPVFDGRLYVTTSLPWLLEVGHPSVSKGSGLGFVASRLGFARERTVAFGDGENDVELLGAAEFGIAVVGAHPRLLAVADWTCGGPDEEGVASVFEAYLHSRQ